MVNNGTHPCIVSCRTCNHRVWEGGTIIPGALIGNLPFGAIENPDGSTTELGDGQTLLTGYADAHCTRPDCPHSSTNLAKQATPDDGWLRVRLVELETRITALEG